MRIIVLAGLLASVGALFGPSAGASTLIVQGSTTFNSELMTEHQTSVEALAGVQLAVVPNKSSVGLLALLARRADLAMMSTALDNETQLLGRSNPELPLRQLRAFAIARTRAAIIVHRTNPVRSLSDKDLEAVLSGRIVNWREVGGDDLPIRIVAVREGGGVVSTVEAAVLGFDAHISAPNQIRVQTGPQIVTVVEQEGGALGITQVKLTRGRKVLELATSAPIVQQLFLVSLGDPTPPMRAVIDACRAVAATAGLE